MNFGKKLGILISLFLFLLITGIGIVKSDFPPPPPPPPPPEPEPSPATPSGGDSSFGIAIEQIDPRVEWRTTPPLWRVVDYQPHKTVIIVEGVSSKEAYGAAQIWEYFRGTIIKSTLSEGTAENVFSESSLDGRVKESRVEITYETAEGYFLYTQLFHDHLLYGRYQIKNLSPSQSKGYRDPETGILLPDWTGGKIRGTGANGRGWHYDPLAPGTGFVYDP